MAILLSCGVLFCGLPKLILFARYFVGDVMLVNVADVLHRFLTDIVSYHQLHVSEPLVGIESFCGPPVCEVARSDFGLRYREANVKRVLFIGVMAGSLKYVIVIMFSTFAPA